MKYHFFRTKYFKPLGKEELGRIYLFCGLGGRLNTYLPAINRFRKQGFSVVAFAFRTKAILGLTVENLPESIDEVCAAVMKYEKIQPHFGQNIAIGNSMGSVYAIHTASRLPFVDKLVVNTGYALISRHIFEDKIGRHWRKKLIADGMTKETFREKIKSSEPINVLHKLKGKQILICLNKDDNVISFSNSVLYTKTLDEHSIPYEYMENRSMSHGKAIRKNLFSKRLLEFLIS